MKLIYSLCIVLIWIIITIVYNNKITNNILTEISQVDNIIDLNKFTKDSIIFLKVFIKNTGYSDLFIEDVYSDCHCTVIQKDKIKRSYSVGDSCQFNIEIKRETLGYFVNTVYIYGNFNLSPLKYKIKGYAIE